jgi:hypothetical protein
MAFSYVEGSLSHETSLRSWLDKPLYGVMVVMVAAAGFSQLRSQESIREMSSSFLEALKYSSLASMERTERNSLRHEAQRYAEAARDAEHQAKLYSYRSRLDNATAKRIRKRGHNFEAIAVEEEKEAEKEWADVLRLDELRLELWANLTADWADELSLEDTYTEETSRNVVHVCDWGRFFESVCTIVGGASGLVHSIEDEKREKIANILRESEALDQVEKAELMEEFAVALLLDKVDEYNETATSFSRVAASWDERAKRDEDESREKGLAADSFLAEEARTETLIRQDENWEKNNTQSSSEYWSRAEELGQGAFRRTLQASLLSIVPLVFFLVRMGYSMSAALGSVDEIEVKDWFLWVRHGALHVMIFLVAIGLVGSESLMLLGDSYAIPEKAEIVIRLAFLGAGLQVLILYTIPHILKIAPTNVALVAQVATQFVLRFLFLLAFFIMEFLIAWLTLHKFLFAADFVRALGSWEVKCYFALMATLNIVIFELEGCPWMDQSNDEATVLMSDIDGESLASTEISPLTSSEESSRTASPTKDLLNVFSSDSIRLRSLSNSSASTSINALDVAWERTKLLHVFSILMIVCCTCVLHSGMSFLLSRSAVMPLAALCSGSVFLFICCIYFLMPRYTDVQVSVPSPSKMLQYTPISDV